jgi:hypothetical protein
MAFSSIPAREFQSLYDDNVARAHHNSLRGSAPSGYRAASRTGRTHVAATLGFGSERREAYPVSL